MTTSDSVRPLTAAGRDALLFLSPEYGRIPEWEQAIRAIEDEARAGSLDAALGAALLHWYDTTHGNEFGHDHHCPVPWDREVHTQPPDDRCTCGWSDVLIAEAARDAALREAQP